jgi:hypothetical protein
MTDAPPRPEPFTLHTEPAAVEDLRARLRGTRWPDAPEDAGWSFGTDLAYLRELVPYWADAFDWSAQEAELARLPHRTANVVRVTEPARGGHFAAFEEPELYAEELRGFFRPYRAHATAV